MWVKKAGESVLVPCSPMERSSGWSEKKSESARDSLILRDMCVQCETMGEHVAKALVGTEGKEVRGHSPKFRTG
jgi:hypothetical protein